MTPAGGLPLQDRCCEHPDHEQLGLISSTRTAGNQRRYPRHMVHRISLIVVGKRVGVPLSDILEAFAALPHDVRPTTQVWHRVSKIWRVTLQERRNKLERLEDELNGCIGCGCLSMTSCALRTLTTSSPQKAPAQQGCEPVG